MYRKVTPEVRAIRASPTRTSKAWKSTSAKITSPSCRVGDVVFAGWKSIFYYLGRLTHVLPGDALALALVVQWIEIEAPPEDAEREDVKRLFALFEAELQKPRGNILVRRGPQQVHGRRLFVAARLKHYRHTHSIDVAEYPRVQTFVDADPVEDPRRLEEEDGENGENGEESQSWLRAEQMERPESPANDPTSRDASVPEPSEQQSWSCAIA